MNYKNIFLEWFSNEFINSSMARAMANTVEDSPWHREANVLVHTNMVVDQYVSRCPDVWTKKDFLGALMCAFHDTGKPRAEETNERSDGTTYRSYKRHEMFSSAIFLDYILSQSHGPIASLLDLDDIYNIQVMMVHHLPYKYDKEKSGVLKNHMEHYGLVDVFVRCVNSDAYGRDADDTVKTRDQSDQWGRRFKNAVPINLSSVTDVDQTMVLLCGPSGSGKSTFLSDLDASSTVHSMDTVRLSSYGTDDYTEAFKLSCEDSNFNNKVMADLNERLKCYKTVYVDNTNLTRRRRHMYVKARGNFKTEAVLFLNTFKTLRERCTKRLESDPTKSIPEFVLDRQYHSMQPPLVGEVGSVKVVYNGG